MTSKKYMTDEQLFTRAKIDPSALADLYDRYAEKIYRYVYFRVPNKQDAEDIVSATFEKLLRQDTNLRFRESFSAWIHTVAKRKIIDYWRMQKPTLELDDVDDAVCESHDERIDSAASLDGMLSVLQKHERAMLTMHVVDGYTYSEIADTYGISQDVVKKRFERLKKKCQSYVS